jgi:hypothetical protein
VVTVEVSRMVLPNDKTATVENSNFDIDFEVEGNPVKLTQKVGIYVYIYMFIHMYVHIYICLLICVYIYIYVSINLTLALSILSSLVKEGTMAGIVKTCVLVGICSY